MKKFRPFPFLSFFFRNVKRTVLLAVPFDKADKLLRFTADRRISRAIIELLAPLINERMKMLIKNMSDSCKKRDNIKIALESVKLIINSHYISGK